MGEKKSVEEKWIGVFSYICHYKFEAGFRGIWRLTCRRKDAPPGFAERSVKQHGGAEVLSLGDLYRSSVKSSAFALWWEGNKRRKSRLCVSAAASHCACLLKQERRREIGWGQPSPALWSPWWYAGLYSEQNVLPISWTPQSVFLCVLLPHCVPTLIYNQEKKRKTSQGKIICNWITLE